MNLFEKYGIKEVADVVFYSITPVGDEEIYTPVLFLDTLKVSTLEKSAEKVSAEGGKGNKKLITWNFGKEITLSLEDALFSPASMSMIWGGELQAKLSSYTSAITKLMMANKYGKLHYSTKAYPSPALTDEEWDIIFRAIQEVSGFKASDTDPESGASEFLPRLSKIQLDFAQQTAGTAGTFNLFPNWSVNGAQVRAGFYPTIEDNEIPRGNYLYLPPEMISDRNGKNEVGGESYQAPNGKEETPNRETATITKPVYGGLGVTFGATMIFYDFYELDYETSGDVGDRNYQKYWYKLKKVDTPLVYLNNDSVGCPFETYTMELIPGGFNGVVWKENYNGDDPYIEEARDMIRKTYFRRDGSDSDHAAMAQSVIEKIFSMIDSLKKLGHIETQIHDLEVVDRMEKCIVRNKDGLKISTAEQKKNLLRYYQDDRTSSYIIYYDAKTMLPLLSVSDDGIIKGWDAASDPDFKHDRDFDRATDVDVFTIKPGTVYYKWTRTVKYKEGDDDGILGRTFVIDADTFPEAYKIVGETYVRNQKTGKDQRCQFIIHRAQVSSDTSITLEAEGDPTTFSMSIDVLTPPNDIMIELKQFDVDEDVLHGGTRIIPQKSTYTYTPTSIDFSEKNAPNNDEMY